MHEGTPIKSHIVKFFSIINDLDKIEVKIEDEDQTLYYCVLYLFHIRVLGKLSCIEASQQSRSMRLRSICLIRTKLIPSWQVSLIMMISGKFIIQERRVIMKVSQKTQNTKIWRTTIVTRRGTFDLSAGFERRNNQMLMSLNWLKEMSNATFYLLQTDQLITKIDEL